MLKAGLTMRLISAADHHVPRHGRWILTVMHMAVMTASVLMIVWITHDTLDNISFLSSPAYLRFQFWICLLFLADIVAEWCFAPRKWAYIASHIMFILVSIPYLNIIKHFGLHVGGETEYLLRFVPMIRAGYVLALVSGALSSNKALSMFWVYVIWLLASLYFAALMFFVEEHFINSGVDTVWSALWWAVMSMTTTGSSISPLTVTGQALGTFLSAEGLMLFPVFTVYITQAVIKNPRHPNDKRQQPSATTGSQN